MLRTVRDTWTRSGNVKNREMEIFNRQQRAASSSFRFDGRARGLTGGIALFIENVGLEESAY
jgi:hypothetical protein